MVIGINNIEEARNDQIGFETSTKEEIKTQEAAQKVFTDNSETLEQFIEKKELAREATQIDVTLPTSEEKTTEEAPAEVALVEKKETALVAAEAVVTPAITESKEAAIALEIAQKELAPVAPEPAKVAEPVQQTAEKTQAVAVKKHVSKKDRKKQKKADKKAAEKRKKIEKHNKKHHIKA